MAISTFASFQEYIDKPRQIEGNAFGTLTPIVGRWFHGWPNAFPAGTVPTTAVAPTSATAGAIGQWDSTTGTLGLVQYDGGMALTGTVLICDRLSHQGGLSGTTVTAQTTNLPTAALTRYTDGVGVMCSLDIYTIVGTTAQTVTISYTNQDGTSGRTSPAVAFGASNFREAPRSIMIPLQSGDTGIRSVQSVTLGGTTGTAGNFGVTLFKPLLMAHIVDGATSISANFVDGYCTGGIPEIVDGACLYMLYNSSTVAVNISATNLLSFGEF